MYHQVDINQHTFLRHIHKIYAIVLKHFTDTCTHLYIKYVFKSKSIYFAVDFPLSQVIITTARHVEKGKQ